MTPSSSWARLTPRKASWGRPMPRSWGRVNGSASQGGVLTIRLGIPKQTPLIPCLRFPSLLPCLRNSIRTSPENSTRSKTLLAMSPPHFPVEPLPAASPHFWLPFAWLGSKHDCSAEVQTLKLGTNVRHTYVPGSHVNNLTTKHHFLNSLVHKPQHTYIVSGLSATEMAQRSLLSCFEALVFSCFCPMA